MKTDPFLSVIVVNHNTREHLKRCLESVYMTAQMRETEVFVVDNDSADGSVQMVEQRFPQVKIIRNAANVGYSKAVNQAMVPSVGKYLLILNADTVVKPGALKALLSFMENHPDCGIAGPKLLYPDGRLQHSCRTFQTLKTILFRRTVLGRIFPENNVLKEHLMLDWDHSTEREVDWLQGSALMIRKSSINQTGPMDERYFLYFEDVDLCRRMKNAGWKVFYVPQGEIVHYYGRASYGKTILNRDLWVHLLSMLRYHEKWSNPFYAAKLCLKPLKTPFLISLDFMGILFSFWLAFSLRKYLGTIDSKPLYPINIYFQPVLIFSVCSLSIYYFMGCYKNRRHQSWVDRFFAISKGALLSFFAILLLYFFSKGYQYGLLYSRFILVAFLIFHVLVILGLHQSVHSISRLLWRHGFNLKRTLVVGTDETAMAIGKMLRTKSDLGYDLVGFISFLKTGETPEGVQVIGNMNDIDLADFSVKERIQEVIFVNIDEYFERVVLPLIRLKRKFICARILSSDSESKVIDTRIKDFFGFPSLEFEQGPYLFLAWGLKRLMDLLLASFSLIVLSPLILFTAIILKAEGGKAFFVQKRIGKDGREFQMYKFRSMFEDAEKVKGKLDNHIAEGPIFKVKNDPRVTPVGRALRRYNIDEIPQLFNVVKGNMSIMGPRPPLPEEVATYEGWHKARLETIPGITGLWQVDKDRKWKFDEMIRLDIYYILNWSLMLDIKILFRTPGAILRGTGFDG